MNQWEKIHLRFRNIHASKPLLIVRNVQSMNCIQKGKFRICLWLTLSCYLQSHCATSEKIWTKFAEIFVLSLKDYVIHQV